MSVIVRTPSNEIRIYCKGAETVVLPRLKYYTPDAVGKLQDKLSAAEYDYIAQTEQHINHYARKGAYHAFLLVFIFMYTCTCCVLTDCM
jgi:magnesium-transporting ATPase (P-type)